MRDPGIDGRPSARPGDTTARAVRQAGSLFVATGVLGLVEFCIPSGVGYGEPRTLAIDFVGLVVGGLTWTPLARRLTGYRSLILAIIALASIAFGNAFGVIAPIPLGIYFVIIFMWIGQWHPRGTSLRMAPIAAIAYVVPFLVGAPAVYGAIPSVALVIPVSVLAGEALAGYTGALRLAHQQQEETLAALARANRTDDLTGLGNRRLGNQLLDRLVVGDAVVILDLDEFKRVNDEFGHARGDELLYELGRFLQQEVRAADTVARMGGEEFLLVIHDAPLAESARIVERLLTAWRQTNPLATLSAGVDVQVTGRTPSNTYARADSALYSAKHLGRDRMVIAGATSDAGHGTGHREPQARRSPTRPG